MPFVDELKRFDAARHGHDIRGTVVREWVLPAKEYGAVYLDRGQVLRFVDLEGQQCPDVTFFNRYDLDDHLNNGNSQQIAPDRRFKLRMGDVLVSQMCTPLVSIHDYSNENSVAYSSMCSQEVNLLRYGIANTRNCRDNLAMALAPWGFNARTVPDCFKPFFVVEIKDDGTQEIHPPTTVPGDYYDLRAENDVLVGLSNCPQELNVCNGGKATALGVIIYEPNG
jgi:uncharacterized protein YcgI (DUF1989 family)